MPLLRIESELRKASATPGISYFHRYSTVKERLLTTEYAMTMAGFPGGNDHGPEHIKRVLANLDKLLGRNPLRHVSQYELFLAMMGVLYHDVGILRGRKDHAAASALLLVKEHGSMILSDDEKALVSTIVRSHSSSSDLRKCPPDQHIKGYDVRFRAIAALVRLSDELDEDVRRADPTLRAKLELPKESQFYWRFNEVIRGIRIDRQRSDIEFNVAFNADDLTRSEAGVKHQFLELCIKKILKVNGERAYCNQFLPADLQIHQFRLTIQPIDGLLGSPVQLLLPDDATLESVSRQLPPRLLNTNRSAKRPQRLSLPNGPVSPDAYARPTGDEAIVNGYKLYYFRTNRRLSIHALSQATGVPTSTINDLEHVKVTAEAPECFKSISRASMSRLEHSLGAVGRLEYGQVDDLLASYIMYYNVNHKPRQGSTTNTAPEGAPDTKAVVFDFGGTLTKTQTPYSTWEKMWLAVGYGLDDAGHLLRLFRANKISHQDWCDQTCVKLRDRAFSRQHMREIMKTIQPVEGLHTTLKRLHDDGIRLYIVSGSVREIIASVLKESLGLFTEVKANDISYDRDGLIERIRGHHFDFEGKATFLRRVSEELRCRPLEVLFVGNSLNDTWASESGARTLCVNPSNVDFTDTTIWNDYISEMKTLEEILPFTGRVASIS
jgi:HAD superfamily phosphoserine phosphatase-like hydrolase